MREFKYGVGVIAPIFLLNLLLVKMSEKSLTKADFRGKNQKDMSDDGTLIFHNLILWFLLIQPNCFNLNSYANKLKLNNGYPD